MSTETGDAASGRKRELLRTLLAEGGLDPSRMPVVRRKAGSAPPPLSYAQEELWLHDQIEPGNVAFNVVFPPLRLEGKLDAPALERALQELVRRHETLRTTFSRSGEQPVQIVAHENPLSLPRIELQDRAAPEQEAEIQRLLSWELEAAFDLERGPLLRTKLLCLGPATHVLLIAVHHIIFDGPSMGVFFRELSTLYNAFLSGRSSPLAPLPFQYADFALWQRQWLPSDGLHEQLAYWKRQLQGVSEVRLPVRDARAAGPSYKALIESLALPNGLSNGLKNLARREGVTLYIVLLAAFKLMLHRYSSQDDIVVGTPVTLRRRPELADLFGLLVNMVALRSDFSGEPTFRELLGRVRESVLRGVENCDVPFSRVLHELGIHRGERRNPLVQAVLNFDAAAAGALRFDGVHASLMRGSDAVSRFDIEAYVTDAPDGLGVDFVCATDLFTRETLRQMVAHFRMLLGGIVANPNARISDFPLLTEPERRQVLEEWNATDREYGGEGRLHRRIEAQARRTPQAVALEYEGAELTYAELNRRANQLARVLRKKGVGPDVLVGVYAERSFELVLALLGILKAGGAYVPLDPSYPKERLAQVLEDARAPLVLAQPQLAGELPGSGAQVLVLDASGAAYAGESGGELEDVGTPESLAYVIFTSGSTGRPKGAMNEHRGIVNRLLWMQEEYGLTAADRVLQKTPFSFDVSVWEFFWPLLSGARLVIARPEGHRDSAYLVKLIRESGITTLHFVPSMLRVFLEDEGLEACGSLKRVICSGEALTRELQERFFARLPEVELHNLYGPTEAAVDVTYWACRRGDERLTVPIGRPVANTQMYVLDARMQPVPMGVPGELYIGGVQVGRGYVGRPELTAERFVPDPFSKTPGARLYKTGDLARHLPDGAIEYLGRLDFQVKIRGQRIELGEIEAVLDGHPGVGQSVVLAREDAPGDQRLVAYVVAKGEAPCAAELTEHLVRTLPPYMVPSAFVILEALPLTSSGKLDRNALPAPDSGLRGLRTELVEPRNATEEQLADIWRNLLRVDRVGIEDSFFDLGGHSLLATQLVSRVRAAFDVEIPLRTVFECRTIKQLALEILDRQAEALDPEMLAQMVTTLEASR